MGFSFKQAAPPPIQAPPVPAQAPKPNDAQDALGNSGVVDIVKQISDDSTQSSQDRALTLQMVAEQATNAERTLGAASSPAKKPAPGLPSPKKAVDDFVAPNKRSKTGRDRGKRTATIVASYIPLVGGLLSKGGDMALDHLQDPEEQKRREDAARSVPSPKQAVDDFVAPNKDSDRGKRTATIAASYIPLVGGLLSKGGDLALDHLQDPEEQQQREDEARAAQEEAARLADEAARAAEEARKKAEEEARKAAENAGSQAQQTGQNVVNTVSSWLP